MGKSLVEHVARALYIRRLATRAPSTNRLPFLDDETAAEVVVAAIFDPDTGWLAQPEIRARLLRAMDESYTPNSQGYLANMLDGALAAVRVAGDDDGT